VHLLPSYLLLQAVSTMDVGMIHNL
jgi:hypothetical protein